MEYGPDAAGIEDRGRRNCLGTAGAQTNLPASSIVASARPVHVSEADQALELRRERGCGDAHMPGELPGVVGSVSERWERIPESWAERR